MKAPADLAPGELRQLAVGSLLKLPVGATVHLLVASVDVIYSLGMPTLTLKVGAIPGRLNLAEFVIARPGTFYGQFPGLCGVLHGFMPIGI